MGIFSFLADVVHSSRNALLVSAQGSEIIRLTNPDDRGQARVVRIDPNPNWPKRVSNPHSGTTKTSLSAPASMQRMRENSLSSAGSKAFHS